MDCTATAGVVYTRKKKIACMFNGCEWPALRLPLCFGSGKAFNSFSRDTMGSTAPAFRILQKMYSSTEMFP